MPKQQCKQLRVVVATGTLPFAKGGAEFLALELTKALLDAGHDAEQIQLFHRPFGSFSMAYALAACTNVQTTHEDKAIDLAISLRFPAYALRHKRHSCWMVHQARPYYDLWNDFYKNLPSWKHKAKEHLRRMLIHLWDRRCLSRVSKLFALSKEVQGRLAKSGFTSEVLYPPLRHGLDYGPSKDSGSFILSPSRLDRQKRIDWLLRAMASIPTAHAVLVGEGPQKEELKQLSHHLRIQDRVDFRGRVSDQELSELYRQARFVYFCPHQEEFGFVALEAMSFAKTLLTTIDSGGPTEIVRDGQSAIVVQPDQQAVEQAIRNLVEDPELAGKLGQAAYHLRPHGTWNEAVKRLTFPAYSLE